MKIHTYWALRLAVTCAIGAMATACGDEAVVAGGSLAETTAASDGAVVGDVAAQADGGPSDAGIAEDSSGEVALFPDVVPVDLGPTDLSQPDTEQVDTAVAEFAGDADAATDPDTGGTDTAGPETGTAEAGTTAEVAAEVEDAEPADAGPETAITDAQVDGGLDSAGDVAATDDAEATEDAGLDSAPDIAPDIALDIAPDTAGDISADAAAETVAEAGAETAEDTAGDAVGDSAAETTADSAADTAADALADSAADAVVETNPDTAPEVTPPECTVDADCAANGAAALCHVWQCQTGKCGQFNAVNGQACLDGNACTTAAACQNGQCSQKTAKNCDDANLCTVDSCDATAGTCANKPTAAFCDDSDLCTEADSCKDGACVSGPAKACADNNECTADACDSQSGKCENKAKDGACNDSDKCTTVDTCQSGTCKGASPLACNDNNACTDDSCDAKQGCVALPNAATCADAAKCLLGTCSAGACKPGASNGCNDNNPCTTDTCDSTKGCLYSPLADGATCGQGDLCTSTPKCAKSLCGTSVKTDCNDGNLCTDDLCEPSIGCKWVPNKATCEDGDACTASDTCSNGKCLTGKPVDPKVFCDDTNSCTDDACDKVKGCTHAAKAGVCDDANPCTTGEVCANGACAGGKTGNCDDGKQCTIDNCDAKTGDCSWTAKIGPCDDGNLCTSGDACQGATCLSGAAIVCDDSDSCTANSCDPKTGCAYKPTPGAEAKACDGTVSGTACFKAFAATTNWQQAQTACVAWGGHLTSITSVAENTAVRGVANTVCGNNSALHIGINDIVTEGKFVWPDGTPVAYTNWQGGEPNNCTGCCSIANAGEDGGQMMASGTWNDLCTATTLPCYVCRRPIPTVKCADPSTCKSGGTCISGKCAGLFTNCDDGNGCTNDVCNASSQGCTHAAAADGTKCGIGVCTAGACTPGVDLANPATSCASIPKSPTPTDGLYWIDPDGKTGAVVPVQTACVWAYGGGWALVAIAADDAQNSWTWNNRAYWTTNTAVFGSPAVGNKDFKSALLHTLPFKDLLFVHAPSLVWATYAGTGDGKQSLAQKINALGANPICYQPNTGAKMTAGTLVASAALCETSLYFNMNDHDGNPTCGDDDQSWGPGWNTYTNGSCPFDDPGITGGIGPLASAAANEQVNCGFGQVLGLNKGTAGTGANRMMVFVR